MLILIDHANVDSIKKTLEYLPIDGVTTNPTILYLSLIHILHASELPGVRRRISSISVCVRRCFYRWMSPRAM